MIPETRARKIAEVMVKVLKDTVWPAVLQLAEHHDLEPFGPLNPKVGRGKSTYHKITIDEESGDMAHRIIFGKDMVMSKFSERQAGNWLSTHEIREKGYFGGEVTLAHLLSHTILHESAHAIQRMAGERVKGEVHNPQFYRWLDLLSDLAGHECLEDLVQRCRQKALSLEFDKRLDPPDEIITRDQVAVGDLYEATLTSGETVTVAVQKVNRKTVTGRTEGGLICRLQFTSLRKKSGSKPAPAPTPARPTAPPVQLPGGDIKSPITEFIGSTYFLSCDFYCPVNFHSHWFYSGKHLYYWLLATRIRDQSVKGRIEQTHSLEALDAILADYRLEFEALSEELKIRALKRTIWEKFQNKALQKRLMETGERPLEPTDKEIHPALGRQLMALRAHLKETVLKAAG